jgi:hypothetical protein
MFSSKQQTTLRFWNSRTTAWTIFMEPLGEDFTLLAGEHVEITVVGFKEAPRFTIDEGETCTVIWIDNSWQDYYLTKDGKRLQCGYQREATNHPGLQT